MSHTRVLFFDGIDELPGLDSKKEVRRLIGAFLAKYPGNTTIVTSRIVGMTSRFVMSR